MTSSRTRRAVSVALVAVALAGLRTAAAGGVGSGELLVGQDAGPLCSDGAVDVGYDVAYDDVLGGYGVSAARLTGLTGACRGYDAVVRLAGPGGAQLAELTGPVEGAELRLAVPAGVRVPAGEVASVSVVLRGTDA